MATDRYFYFRAHAHPLGWGVGDSKTGAVVAFGDKNTCAAIAGLMNGESGAVAASLFKNFSEFADSSRANGAPAFRYNHATGGLELIVSDAPSRE